MAETQLMTPIQIIIFVPPPPLLSSCSGSLCHQVRLQQLHVPDDDVTEGHSTQPWPAAGPETDAEAGRYAYPDGQRQQRRELPAGKSLCQGVFWRFPILAC